MILQKRYSAPKEEIQKKFDDFILIQTIPEDSFDYELVITDVDKEWVDDKKNFVFYLDGESSMKCSLEISDAEVILNINIPGNMEDLSEAITQTMEETVWQEIFDLS